MAIRRISFILLAAILSFSFFSSAPTQTAHADDIMNFVSASASCTEGSFSFDVELIPSFPEARPGAVVGGNTVVEAYDDDGTFLGSETFDVYVWEPDTYFGTIVFSPEANGPTVTFELYYDQGIWGDGEFAPGRAGQAEPGDTLADSITVDVNCEVPEPVAVPGCDTLISLAGAVSGSFVSTTSAYWAPSWSAETNPVVTIEEGKTLYVFGQDSSHQFSKVLLVCQFLWVPKDTVGPNYDEVWNGTPLPTDVVD